jgi:hypothetical protein
VLLRSCIGCGEHKEPLIWGRRTEEGEEIDQDVGSEFDGAGGMMDFLSFDLSPTPVGGDQISERSIPLLPDVSDHSGGWFFRNEKVQQYVPPS